MIEYVDCKQPIKKTFAYERNGKEIGRASVIIDFKVNGKPAATIEDVFVEEEFRKQGVGKLLVERCVNEARFKGCYKVVLMCADHNVNFYTKCGFRLHQNGMRMDTA